MTAPTRSLATRAPAAWHARDRRGVRHVGSLAALAAALMAWLICGPAIVARGALALDNPGLYGAFLAGFALLVLVFCAAIGQARWPLALTVGILGGIYLTAGPAVLTQLGPIVVESAEHRAWGLWMTGAVLGIVVLMGRFLQLTVAPPHDARGLVVETAEPPTGVGATTSRGRAGHRDRLAVRAMRLAPRHHGQGTRARRARAPH